MQGIIQAANASKSGKTLRVQVNGQWYSTKHWELQNLIGQEITAQVSQSDFQGTPMHWLNDYTVVGQGGNTADAAFQAAYAQQPNVIERVVTEPKKTDKDLQITALALVKCIEGIQSPQQAVQALNDVKRLLQGKPPEFSDPEDEYSGIPF